MKKTLLVGLAVAWTLALGGCTGGGPTAAEKEFQKLYRQYSDKFYERMTGQTEKMTTDMVYAEADRLWGETFGSHKDLIKRRAAEILAALDNAPPGVEGTDKVETRVDSKVEIRDVPNLTLNGVVYSELATFTPRADLPVYKQFQWNPVNAASIGVNLLLTPLLKQNMIVRNILVENGGAIWEVMDRRESDKPKLMLRQGPLVFTVDLIQADDFYKIEKVRLLRAKSMGPLLFAEPGATGSGGPAVSPSPTSAAATGSVPPPMMTPTLTVPEPTPSGTVTPTPKAPGAPGPPMTMPEPGSADKTTPKAPARVAPTGATTPSAKAPATPSRT